MASIDVGIHPDPSGITTHHFPAGNAGLAFSTLVIEAGAARAAIFVNRAVFEALQAALHEIETDMGRAEQAAMKAAQTASDQVPWPAGPPGELVEAFGR